MQETKEVIEHLCTRFVTDQDEVRMYSLCYTKDEDNKTENGGAMVTMTPKEARFKLRESKYLMDDDELAKVLVDNAISIATKSMYDCDTDFDLDLSHNFEDAVMVRRRLITRILSVSNLITIGARMGPANVMILSHKAFDFINYRDTVSDAGYFMSIKCIPHDGVGNKIVMLRRSEHTAAFVSHKYDANKYRFIPAVDSDQSNRQHMAFRVNLF